MRSIGQPSATARSRTTGAGVRVFFARSAFDAVRMNGKSQLLLDLVR